MTSWGEGKVGHGPLALISCLLGLLELGEGDGETLLGAIELLLDEGDSAVESGHLLLSLREKGERGGVT